VACNPKSREVHGEGGARTIGGDREKERTDSALGKHGDSAFERGCSHSRERGRGDAACGNRVFGLMIGLSAGTQIWIAAGVTDLRRGFTGLSGMVQTALQENPFSGHVFVFRGRRGDLIKLLWWSGDGLCLFAKRLERGRFIWPQATSGPVSLTQAQLSMLLEGIDWRRPVRSYDPQKAV
jgi:transposase